MPDFPTRGVPYLPGAVKLPRRSHDAWHGGVDPNFTDMLHADRLVFEWQAKQARAVRWSTRLHRGVGWVALGLAAVAGVAGTYSPARFAYAILMVYCLIALALVGLMLVARSVARSTTERLAELTSAREVLVKESNAQFVETEE